VFGYFGDAAFVLAGCKQFDGASDLVQLLQLLRLGVLSSVAARFVVIYSSLGVLNFLAASLDMGRLEAALGGGAPPARASGRRFIFHRGSPGLLAHLVEMPIAKRKERTGFRYE